METTQSADTTIIAYEATGSGDVAVVVPRPKGLSGINGLSQGEPLAG